MDREFRSAFNPQAIKTCSSTRYRFEIRFYPILTAGIAVSLIHKKSMCNTYFDVDMALI